MVFAGVPAWCFVPVSTVLCVCVSDILLGGPSRTTELDLVHPWFKRKINL